MTDRTSLTGARWTVAPVDEARVTAMRGLGPLREVTLRCMALRGFDPNGGWLTPDVSQLLDPHTMLGMDQAITRLRQAIRDQQRALAGKLVAQPVPSRQPAGRPRVGSKSPPLWSLG